MAAQSGAAAGGVGSVNGKTGNVILDGTDLAYTPLYAGTGDPSTTIEQELQWRERKVGTADVVWSEPTLAAAAPLAGSTYPLTTPGLWTAPLGGAPITLTAGLDVTLTNPASIDGLGSTKVALIGDVAGGPVVSGEVQARRLTIGNVNPTGSDIRAESLGGRTLFNDVLTLVGEDAGTLENVVGVSVWKVALVPPASGSSGLSIDGTIGNMLHDAGFVGAPGTDPYVGFTVEPTANVTSLLQWDGIGFTSQVAGDSMILIDNAATLPTGAVPTSMIGVAVTSSSKAGPGSLMDPGGRGVDDIRVFSSGHLSAPSSRYLGDAVFDVTATVGAPDASLTHVGVAPTVDVIPSDNSGGGGVGGTLVTMALDPISQRFTLDLDGGIQNWFLRYDGAPGDLRGQMVWRAQVLKGGGAASTVQGFVQESVGGGAFVTIPQTRSISRGLINNIPGEISGSAPATLSSNHRYRIVMNTTDNAIPTLIRSVTIEIAGSP